MSLESVYQFTCVCGFRPPPPTLSEIPAACPKCGVLWSMEWGKSPIEIQPRAHKI